MAKVFTFTAEEYFGMKPLARFEKIQKPKFAKVRDFDRPKSASKKRYASEK